jgi:flagellin-like protein
MKIANSKKAISPVITTVLLILMVLVLSAIILIWWKSFLGESLTKFDESSGEQKSIQQFCDKVNFDASLSGTDVTLINRANVPVYKVGFQKTTATQEKILIVNNTQIIGGASKIIPLSTFLSDFHSDTDDLYFIPVLLGSNDAGEQKEFQCPKSNWKKII